ncbi:hypothetical protein ACFL54_09115, partial [Planctomycetota bacterium]
MRRAITSLIILGILLAAAPAVLAGNTITLTNAQNLDQEKDPNITVWECRVKPYMDQQENTADFWMCTLCIKDEKLNHGIYWKPSPECVSQDLKDKYQKMVEQRKDFLEESQQRSTDLGVDMEYVRTHHFLIAWNIKEIQCTKKTRLKYGMKPKPLILTKHQAIHIYAMRAEDCWDYHCRDFSMDRMAEKDITEVYWLQTGKQKAIVARKHHYYKGQQVNRIVTASNPAIWEHL